MKKLIALMLICLSSYCLGQTAQVQHGGTGNNSTAENAILVGTGPSTYTLVILPNCLDTAGNHINYIQGSHSATCGTSTSGVTSVSQNNPTGVLSQSGGPITGAGTFAWSWSGTSGGLLCFTGASTAASSGLLTTGNPIIGAGTGSCPTVGTRSGNTTTFGTTSGTLTTQHCAKFDASGNLVDSGAICGTGTVTSVSLTVNSTSPSGIFTVTGSPVTSSGPLNLNLSGTSGGIPYFSSTTVLSSSALLTLNNPVLGGGVGGAPFSGSRSGNTTTFVTSSGSLPANHYGKFNSDGNLTDGGLIIRGVSFTIGDPGTLSALTAVSTTTDYVTVPFGCTISAYNLAIDSGTITVKFWKIATGTAIPTSANSINTSGVSISSGTAIHSTTVSDFTNTTIAANDIMAMNVTAVSAAKFVNGVLECQ